jgi:hypothetical protein
MKRSGSGEPSSSEKDKRTMASSILNPEFRIRKDEKVVGLKDSCGLRRRESSNNSQDTVARGNAGGNTIEDMEYKARLGSSTNPITLFMLGNLAAIKVMFFYLSK